MRDSGKMGIKMGLENSILLMEVTMSVNTKQANKHGYGKEVIFDDTGKVVSVYEGEWKENNKKGKGILKLISGAMYEGHFLRNKYHGKGVYTLPNGFTHEGTFRYGKLYHKGAISRKNL
jgi:hypothetical protein